MYLCDLFFRFAAADDDEDVMDDDVLLLLLGFDVDDLWGDGEVVVIVVC